MTSLRHPRHRQLYDLYSHSLLRSDGGQRSSLLNLCQVSLSLVFLLLLRRPSPTLLDLAQLKPQSLLTRRWQTSFQVRLQSSTTCSFFVVPSECRSTWYTVSFSRSCPENLRVGTPRRHSGGHMSPFRLSGPHPLRRPLGPRVFGFLKVLVYGWRRVLLSLFYVRWLQRTFVVGIFLLVLYFR